MFKLNRLFWSLIIGSLVLVTTAVVTTSLTSCSKKTTPDYSKLSDYVGSANGSDWVTLDDNGNKNTNNGISGTVTCDIEDDYAVLKTNQNFSAHNLVIPNRIKIGEQILPLKLINNNVFNFLDYECNLNGLLVIPNSVTSIGDSAFAACAGITSVIMCDGVESIEEGTFEGCSSLKSVNIPNSVTSIKSWAFLDCVNLSSITIPSKVTSIGIAAFAGCTSLTSVNIPNSVTSIGNSAFSRCKLSNIAVARDNETYKIVTNNGFTFVTQKRGNENVIGHLAYGNLTIPAGIKNIDEWKFAGYAGITSVTIPNSVKSIGDDAFLDCSGLTSINIPSSVESIGENAFSNCIDLRLVTIQNGVANIGDYAFFGCTNLTSITIPSSVTTIGEEAFARCTKLFSITIQNGVQNIGNGAFAGCKLSNIIVDGMNETYKTVSKNGFTFVTIKTNVQETYTSGEIVGCLACGNLSIPSSVKSIGDSAFAACAGITSVAFQESSKVSSIGANAFAGCSGLTFVYIPNSVLTIGDFAFADCLSLKSVTIPNSAVTIGDFAFADCLSLKSVTIPKTIDTIHTTAFLTCLSLTKITIECNPQIIFNLELSTRYGNFVIDYQFISYEEQTTTINTLKSKFPNWTVKVLHPYQPSQS